MWRRSSISMFCASPPPVSPCYGELSPCYGEIISLLSSCSACTVHRQTLPNLLLFKLIFLQKPVLRPPILPVFRLLSGSIRENQGAKPPLDDPAEFASPQARMEPRRLEMCECGRVAAAVQLLGEAVAQAEIKAVWPLLGVLDRYQKAARAIHVDNEETRRKLFEAPLRPPCRRRASMSAANSRGYGDRPCPR